jgi:hypothetical protein
MRKLAIMRGVDIGAMLDYASQVTVGSLRNLALYPGNRALQSPALLALAYATNICFCESQQQLCFRYDWLDGGVEVDVPTGNSDVLIDEGYNGTDAIYPPTTDGWWIETRCLWEAAQSPDVGIPVKTQLAPQTRSEVYRFGSNVIFSSKTNRFQTDRLVSLLVHADYLSYQFTGPNGREAKRVLWTNSRLPHHYVHWNRELDGVLGGMLSCRTMHYLETRRVDIYVNSNADSTVGDYAGMAEFAGFADF